MGSAHMRFQKLYDVILPVVEKFKHLGGTLTENVPPNDDFRKLTILRKKTKLIY